MQNDDKIMWYKAPANSTREEIIDFHDKAVKEIFNKACPKSHILNKEEQRPGTFHWKCNVCGPIATVTLFKDTGI